MLFVNTTQDVESMNLSGSDVKSQTFYFFERFNQVPAIIISVNDIKKIFAAGSGVNEGGHPSETEYPANSIKLLVTVDNSTPLSFNSDKR